MNKKSGSKHSTGKRWVHPPASLTNGHVVYNVKLLGSTEVDQPKGAEVVREAVRKLKHDNPGFQRRINFNKHLKRADGEKPPKVELTISSMGVTIQDRQTKVRMETFPLHRISYCADDKQDKRICAFICKQESTNKNVCYVLDSEKCAEEITLTVGQAFDLAYQQFMQKSGKDLTSQLANLQKKVRDLETENTSLRMRIVELEARQGQQPPAYSESNLDTQPALLKDLMGSPSHLQTPTSQFLYANTPAPAGAVPPYASPPTGTVATTGPQAATPAHVSYAEAGATNGVMHSPAPASSGGHIVQSPGIRRDQPSPLLLRGRPRSSTLPSRTASSSASGTSVASRPRPHGISSPSSQVVPSLAPPPSSGRPRRGTFGSTPAPGQESGSSNSDPFGGAPFHISHSVGAARSNPLLSSSTGSGSSQDLDMVQYREIQEGFASGLTLGNEDLSLADLDPLKNLSNC